MENDGEFDPNESEMLRQVRRWRREAYEQRMKMTPEERQKHDEELARELGLRWHEPQHEQSKESA